MKIATNVSALLDCTLNTLPDNLQTLSLPDKLGKSEVVPIQFYNLKTKEKVEIPDSQVEIITMENGRKAAKAEANGTKLFKFLSKADAEKLSV